MEKKRKGDKRPYAERLLPKSKIRYEKKLLLIDGNDPYELPTNVWSVNPDDLPEITYITIVNYFVLGKSRYTSEEFRAYKSLESYKTFVAGWVRDIRCYQPQGCPNVVVSAKVLHSQRLNEAPLTPWVIVTADGSNILSAHCTCKAGIGETCSHVGALTFACDAFTTTKEKATCTGVKAYWKVPQGIRGVKPAPAYKIDFSSARAKKDRLNNPGSDVSDPEG
ncbi:hypothetical protein BaRGS_00019021 [Batillaria attramentaria]|uniref:SWIM-type domain-containing protein n=1 Tax=Batillaria attramentaria TaxID=370345 RepID=A0ABD0KQR2_9CAEN